MENNDIDMEMDVENVDTGVDMDMENVDPVSHHFFLYPN